MRIIDWLYPKRCVGCGKTEKYFCDQCVRQVRIQESFFCPECNKPSAFGMVHMRCKTEESLDGLVSLLSYQSLVRLGVHRLKYNFLRGVEEEFLDLIKKAIKQKNLEDFFEDKPVVIPIPLYWRRQNWRGFNQAEAVGEMLVKSLGLKMNNDCLVRVRPTKQQIKLTKEKRTKNVKGVFEVGRDLSFDRALLVDDVWTTGSTMREAGKVLKRAGVKRVWGLTLAK